MVKTRIIKKNAKFWNGRAWVTLPHDMEVSQPPEKWLKAELVEEVENLRLTIKRLREGIENERAWKNQLKELLGITALEEREVESDE